MNVLRRGKQWVVRAETVINEHHQFMRTGGDLPDKLESGVRTAVLAERLAIQPDFCQIGCCAKANPQLTIARDNKLAPVPAMAAVAEVAESAFPDTGDWLFLAELARPLFSW